MPKHDRTAPTKYKDPTMASVRGALMEGVSEPSAFLSYEPEWTKAQKARYTERFRAIRGALGEVQRTEAAGRAVEQEAADARVAEVSATPPVIRDVAGALSLVTKDVSSAVARPFDSDLADFINRAAGEEEQALLQAGAGEGSPVLRTLQTGLRGAVRSIGTAALLAPTGGAGLIAGFAGMRGNQAITEGRDAGLRGMDLFHFVGRSALIEGGVAGVFQAAGLGGFEKVLGGGALTGGSREIMKQIFKQTGAELVEENITEVLDAYNQSRSGVTGPVTLEQLGDLFIQTTTQTLMAMGATHTFQNRKMLKGGLMERLNWTSKEADAAIDEDAAKGGPSGTGKRAMEAVSVSPAVLREWALHDQEAAARYAALKNPSRTQFAKSGLREFLISNGHLSELKGPARNLAGERLRYILEPEDPAGIGGSEEAVFAARSQAARLGDPELEASLAAAFGAPVVSEGQRSVAGDLPAESVAGALPGQTAAALPGQTAAALPPVQEVTSAQTGPAPAVLAGDPKPAKSKGLRKKAAVEPLAADVAYVKAAQESGKSPKRIVAEKPAVEPAVSKMQTVEGRKAEAQHIAAMKAMEAKRKKTNVQIADEVSARAEANRRKGKRVVSDPDSKPPTRLAEESSGGPPAGQVAMANAMTLAQRERLGIAGGYDSPGVRGRLQVLQEAREAGYVGRGMAEAVAGRVMAGEHVLTDTDVAGFDLRFVEIENELRTLAEEVESSTDEGARGRIDDQMSALEAEFDFLSTVGNMSGTITARALAARRWTLGLDFGLGSTLARAKAAKRGKPLTKKSRDNLTKLASKHGKLRGRVRSLEAKERAQIAKEAIERSSEVESDGSVDLAALAARAKKLLEGGC